MKSIRNIVSIVVMIVVIFSCSKENDPTLSQQQEMAMALEGTWSHVETVSFPEIGDPLALNDLSITFNVTSSSEPADFEASGAPFFFATNGNSEWIFANTTTTEFINFINSGYVETVKVSLNDTEDVLTMEFAHPGDQNGRQKSLTGDYLIKLNKN